MNLVSLDRLNELCFPSDPVPLRKLQRWCRRQFLPAEKIGGEWRVDLDRLRQPTEQKSKALQDPASIIRSIMDRMRNRA